MKKRRIKKRPILIMIILLLIIGVLLTSLFRSKTIVMLDLSKATIQDIKEFASNNGLILDIKYKNDDNIKKDQVITQSIKPNTIIKKGQALEVTVSLGPIDKKVYQEYKVNEAGRIPIMMYHGIQNITDNKYPGGNIDKDGYQRTANAFRQDLEFYYKNNFVMIRLEDYVNGIIDVPLGKSPIILTFDDGNANNINVIGIDSKGQIIIDPNSAVGILEEFKHKYPDFQVTATFFLNNTLFGQPKYNEKILKWLVDNGYDIGNHTKNHATLGSISKDKVAEEIGSMYQKLDTIIPGKYVNIVALPFGSPYTMDNENFPLIFDGTYNGIPYNTIASLRVGWDASYSPFVKDFNKQYLKRIRAYDNDGKEFDITMNFKLLETTRYISDGDKNKIVIPLSEQEKINNTSLKVITY